MVERNGEEGTTLAELLVVITILLVIGTVTTTGIVRGFSAQLAASNTAETLDGTRIATQRVRDFVRGADEVCASSTATSLVLWTDDDGDGTYVDTELDIFELVTDGGGNEVFQRRTPTAGGDITQLIRDDIINAALFTYDVAPADQPGSLVCTDGVTPSGGPSAIRIVDVQFTVANPDPAESDLTTQTEVRLRNADLVEGTPNIPPVAAFSVTCPAPDRTCDFDATTSADTDGSVATYAWTFAETDGTVLGSTSGPSATTSYTFPVGGVAYDVTLVVTDDGGATGTLIGSANPVEPGANVAPTADFDFTCTGRICDFDAAASSDDVGITDWDWDFAGAATGTGETLSYTFPSDGNHAVTLTVTDTDGDSGQLTLTVTASSATIYVSSMTGVRGGGGNNRTATFTVTLSRTVGGPADAGITVTVSMDPKKSGPSTSSCTTNASGQCSTTLTGLKNNEFPVVGTVVSVTNTGSQVYDAGQNTTDTHTVS